MERDGVRVLETEMKPPRTGVSVLVPLALFLAAAARADGPVVGWGEIPAAVNGTSGTATAVAAGVRHSCAIQGGTGAVVCWGDDVSGQASPPDPTP
jgi:hypothetical protein